MVKMQNFVIWIQIASLLMWKNDFYKDTAEDVETRFETSYFEIKDHYRKKIEVMKDALGGQIMKQFVGLREKRYSYLKDNTDEDKKAKDT